MVDVLSLHTADISFDLRLHCYVTAINGDGNTGKTCIFNKLKEAANKGLLHFDCIFIDMSTLYNLWVLKESCDKLIIIDDFDSVRVEHPEIIKLIEKHQHQILIFGRNLRDLYTDKRFVYSAQHCGNTIKFTSFLPQNVF